MSFAVLLVCLLALLVHLFLARRMRARPLLLSFVVVVLTGIVAVIVYHRPYFRGAKILDADGHSEVTQYAQEFADSLSITPHIYLRGGNGNSPNGRFFLQQRELRNCYHKIILSPSKGPSETVLILQECDPGSGTSHNWQWSRDSNAVFIYGCATPAGHAPKENLALIYIVEQRSLYSIDLSQPLSKRLEAESNPPNQTMQPTAGH